MKKIAYFCIFAMLLLTGCGGQSSVESSPESSLAPGQAALQVTAAENLDPDYAAVITSYFQAINDNDYDAYCAAIYPPFLEEYGAFLQSDGSTMEENFALVRARFDEDGYDSWQLRDLSLRYYSDEPEETDSFFERYSAAGILREDFGKDAQAAGELRNVVFSLTALYEGDKEAVTVVPNGELIVIKTADGTYLFG